jgi:hypothetical protein
MDKSEFDFDEDYERDFQGAEIAYLCSFFDWCAALYDQLARYSIPALVGEVKDGELKRPSANDEIVWKLTEMCREYVASRLLAYGEMVARVGGPASHGVDRLENYERALLEDVRQRKWRYGIKKISEFLDVEDLDRPAWTSIEYFAEMFLRDIVEPRFWFREAKSATKEVSRKSGPADETLRSLAKLGGIIGRSPDGNRWGFVEKRIQEIRQVLRNHFSFSDDPLPFVKNIGYQARFKISLSRSFDH